MIFDGASYNSDGKRMLLTTLLLNLITKSAVDIAQSRPQAELRMFNLYIDEV